jgi:hypothetical protein
MAKQQYDEKTPYQKKLLDPRWQKRRLDILSRDKFTCRVCWDTENTLDVHHKKYNGNPWEAEDKDLITLCESCHGIESDAKDLFKEKSVRWVENSSFSFDDVNDFMQALDKANIYNPHWKILQAFMFILNNENAQTIAISLHDLNDLAKSSAISQFKFQNNIIEEEQPF